MSTNTPVIIYQPTYTTPPQTAWGFAHGLLFGQTIAIIVLAIFFKFVVFVEAKSPKKSIKKSRTQSFYDNESVSGGGGVSSSGSDGNGGGRARPNLRVIPGGFTAGSGQARINNQSNHDLDLSLRVPATETATAGAGVTTGQNWWTSYTGEGGVVGGGNNIAPSFHALSSSILDKVYRRTPVMATEAETDTATNTADATTETTPVTTPVTTPTTPTITTPPTTTTTTTTSSTTSITHAPESLSWFNVLLAQTLNQLRDDALRNDNLLNSLTAVLNSDSRPSFLDTIKITELNLGDDFPIFSNCRIVERDEAGGLEAKIDVDLTDTLTLGIETRLLVYYPKIIKANLPVSLSVSIVRFTATLNLSLVRVDVDNDTGGERDPEAKPKTSLTFSLAPDYNLEFAVRSLVGSKSRLQNVPKIGDIIESRLRHWFVERCVEPKAQEIVLPSFFPRSKNTGTFE